MDKPSFNAVCQAVKVLVPEITRAAHRDVCGYPDCFTASNRYWRETYNIRPWNERKNVEKAKALAAAEKMIATATRNGVRCPKIDKMIASGVIEKPNDEQLELAGYHYHHRANRRGYCPVDCVGMVREYSGRFGHGFIRHLGRGGRNFDSTVYEAISYWVK